MMHQKYNRFKVGDKFTLDKRHPAGRTLEIWWFETTFTIIECEEDCYWASPDFNKHRFYGHGRINFDFGDEPFMVLVQDSVSSNSSIGCLHPNKRFVINTKTLQYWFCPDCKQEVEK